MPERNDEDAEDTALSDRLLDALVFAPVGLVVSVVEEFPKLAERGRERLGVRVSSARAVGQLVVTAGQHELRRRSDGLLRRDGAPDVGHGPVEPHPAPSGTSPPVADHPAEEPNRPEPTTVDGHIPDVSTLSIPGFDTLSASQVVQRLDGLNREELVSVRAYEFSTRGRRTILNRVDQLLDERS
jgi:hypothetical protein